jgi:putative ABC transport system substrate-binding protein
LLVNPNNPNTDNRLEEMREAARAVGRELLVATAKSENEFELAFATIRQRAGALVVPPDPSFTARRDEPIALAARYAMPASYPFREYAVSGGLMSYGASLSEAYRLAGNYCGRVLRGEKPADLPVQQTTKIEFVINLKTAKVARSQPAASPAWPRRRGDRMKEDDFRYWPKADMTLRGSDVRFRA